MQKEALVVNKLNVSFGDNKIIKNLSLKVNEGDVLVVLGPNGAGKTTLLKSLIGSIPYKGKISWKKKDISYLPPQELFQRKDLPPLSIEEFFKFKRVTDKQISKIFDKVGLDKKLLKRKFDSLSTGQFQRMTIAWALVDEPSVLLFDEPTSGIDVGGRDTIYSLLHKIWQERNLTIIFVTHDLNVVWEHADQVLCINKKKVCAGKPKKILTTKLLRKLYGTGVKLYKHR